MCFVGVWAEQGGCKKNFFLIKLFWHDPPPSILKKKIKKVCTVSISTANTDSCIAISKLNIAGIVCWFSPFVYLLPLNLLSLRSWTCRSLWPGWCFSLMWLWWPVSCRFETGDSTCCTWLEGLPSALKFWFFSVSLLIRSNRTLEMSLGMQRMVIPSCCNVFFYYLIFRFCFFFRIFFFERTRGCRFLFLCIFFVDLCWPLCVCVLLLFIFSLLGIFLRVELDSRFWWW